MHKWVDVDDGQKRIFLGLKWKMFLVLTLVFLVVNGSSAFLVYRKTAGLLETQLANRRIKQVRDLNLVLSDSFARLEGLAAFLSQLMIPMHETNTYSPRHWMFAKLAVQGEAIVTGRGMDGVYYFAADDIRTAAVTWPARRAAPEIETLLEQGRRSQRTQARLVCDHECAQIVVSPVFYQKRLAGLLVVELAIAASQKRFSQLSSADFILIDPADTSRDAGVGRRASSRMVGIAPTRADAVARILRAPKMSSIVSGPSEPPQRFRDAAEWYDVFRAPVAGGQSGLDAVIIDRVTGQVLAIEKAARDSLLIGIVGALLYGLVVLALLWRPTQRIRDAMRLLPALADSPRPWLHRELTQLDRAPVLPDEIDRMFSAMGGLSRQIDSLERARSVAEQGLRDSEQSLQLAQSMARVASCAGEPSAGIFRITEGAGRIHEALESVGTWVEFQRLVHPEDRSRVQAAWRRCSAVRAMDIEFRLLIDERVIYLHAMAEFADSKSCHGPRAAGMLQDVTDLRAAERICSTHHERLETAVLERMAQLDSARNAALKSAQTKSDFLANMSHEIRTPLNAVLGLSQIGMQQSYNREIAATFHQIINAGELLLRIVNEILELSKLEAGKLTIEARPFELRKILLQCMQMLQQPGEAKSLQMALDIASDVPEWVIGDAHRLQQILLNLLSNAVKFTERGSVQLEVSVEAPMLCFRVIDSGFGMSFEQIDRLFTPYQQGLHEGPMASEGTGLGLCISKGLATLMGGDITVHSRPGDGSQFVLRLPLPAGSAPDIAQTRRVQGTLLETTKPLVGIRILVVDDVAVNRLILEMLLHSQGATVRTASTGAEAVSLLFDSRGSRFHIVFMDVEMPGMSGRQATSAIRERGLDIPIIGVTAHVSAEARQASIAAGMTDQLVKPVMPEALVDKVLRHARERIAVRSVR
ncbi:MAG: ATP-binding protein [Sedimenticolaceae bacterium]